MSRGIFVDTSAWYALADAGDLHHAEAARRLQRLVRAQRKLVTTNHVVGETYTLLRVRLGQAAGKDYLRRMRESASVRRTFILESWEGAAEELLARYDDQDFSYVDATSFIAMRHLRLEEAFAFDHHFTIAGFTVLRDEG